MPQDTSTPTVIALDHFVLTVADLPATLRFYSDVLGMQAAGFTTATGERRQALRFGTAKINLHQHRAEFEPNAAQPTPGSADLCFLTAESIPAWQDKLAALNIPIEQGPVPRTGAQGPLTSLYIRDPDGNLIEISVAG